MNPLTAISQSKLARRFALIFLGCAFLPTLLLLYLSYHRVSSEMLERSIDKLSGETKSYGLSLLDRMVRVRDHLSFIAGEFDQGGVDATGTVEGIFAPETLEVFEGLSLVTDNAPVITIMGEPRPLDYFTIRDGYRSDLRPANVFTEQVAAGPDRIFQAYPVQLPHGSRGYVVGEVNLAYLWGYGDSPLLPEQTNLAVYDESGKGLFATDISPGKTINFYWEQSKDPNFRRFEFQHDGNRYLAGAWQLFLPSKFDGDIWTIVLSEPEAYILASLGTFQRNLIMVVMLGLLVVLLLTMFFIRRRLEPLKALKSRTEQIARKDFTTEVVVNSGDEFEELAGSFNSMSRELQKQFSALETIDVIDRAILSSLSLSEMINTTLPMIRDFFHCDTIVMGSFLEKNSGDYSGYAHTDRMTSPETENFMINRERQQALFLKPEPHFWQAEERQAASIPSLSSEQHQTILSVPLKNDNDNIGLLILGYRGERLYDNGELKQLRQLADQVAIALSNAGLVKNLENLATGTIEALARTVDAKSKWTSGHSERVAGYATQIATAMGLGGKDIALVHRGGLLHDIGKIGTPIAILDKAARLDDQEYWEIKKHPQIGATIIEPVSVHRDIMHIILEHHERFDGKGYPRGLTGEEISLHGRITAVADVFDALSSARPYRQSWNQKKVRDFIVEQSGSHFDPAVVSAFTKAFAGGMVDLSPPVYEYNFSSA